MKVRWIYFLGGTGRKPIKGKTIIVRYADKSVNMLKYDYIDFNKKPEPTAWTYNNQDDFALEKPKAKIGLNYKTKGLKNGNTKKNKLYNE